MRISQNTAAAAAYTPAPVAEKKGRELSETQQKVQAQLAHNKQQAKVDGEKLAKISGKSESTTAAGTAKNGNAPDAAAGAAAATTAPTTSTKAAANARSADSAETTQSTTKKPAHKETVFEKQHAHNQSMAKIHAAMLDKVANKQETPKTDTAQPSAAAAQAATAKYMENSGQSTGSTTTHFRA